MNKEAAAIATTTRPVVAEFVTRAIRESLATV
jgi:hypothetical protein